ALTGISGLGLLESLLYANVSLALFNLLPAFPMDGGRALRAFLAMRMGSRRATSIAVQLGRGVAVLMAIAGVVFSPLLLVIGLFVWFAGSAEAKAARAGAYDDRRSVRVPARAAWSAWDPWAHGYRGWTSAPRVIVVRRGVW